MRRARLVRWHDGESPSQQSRKALFDSLCDRL